MLVRSAILAALAVLSVPSAQADSAGLRRTWLERVAINAADETCHLFNPGEKLALRSGMYQAEGELLRNGESAQEMRQLSVEVSERAGSLGCGHPDIVSVAATVRNAYRQFAKTSYIEYPAARSTWGASRSVHDRWAASQTDKTSGLMFGLRRVPGQPDQVRLVVAMPAQGVTPASAQLVFRDTAKMSDPWLGSISGKGGKLAAPPRSVSRLVWAGKVMSARDEVGNPLWIFAFNVSAIDELEMLDPREAVQVNLLAAASAKDQKTKEFTFELGDFRSARAFSMIPVDEPAAPQQIAEAH
jgi:hypothetical protein